MTRLHIGPGAAALTGWINIDIDEYPGVDRVIDVRKGLPFRDVELIFAEHFIEHLTLSEGMAFLEECRRALATDGILRLSTPNLDWVWASHYRPPQTLDEELALIGCLELNRAFHGWGHKFLYNFTTLNSLLRDAGFASVSRFRHGESEDPRLRDLEQHELGEPYEGLEALLSVEASGVMQPQRKTQPLLDEYLRDFNVL